MAVSLQFQPEHCPGVVSALLPREGWFGDNDQCIEAWRHSSKEALGADLNVGSQLVHLALFKSFKAALLAHDRQLYTC